MHRAICVRLMSAWVMVLAMVVYLPILSGCGAMPAHSNTLVFGTTTKVAIDVSSEPTGTVGVTIGYKRSEAVWMPLIANGPGKNGRPLPNECKKDDCTKLVGTPNEDTYSVLATFSGDTSGAASNAEAKGKVVQYFATGWAARQLVVTAGAASVNSGVTTPSQDRAAVMAAMQLRENQELQIEAVLKKGKDANGSFNSNSWNVFLQSPAVAQSIPDSDIRSLKAAIDLQTAEKALRNLHLGYLNTIFQIAVLAP